MSVSSVSRVAQAMPQPKVSSVPVKSGRDSDGDTPESDRPIRDRSNRRLAGWFVAFLVLLVTALAVTWNRSGIGLEGGQRNEDRRGTTQSPTVSSIPVDVKYLLDDAQREEPRGSTNPPIRGAYPAWGR
jgi:hypothetical protein